MQKPSIPKGTRDFSPEEMAKRNYIFDTIRAVFHLHGFSQIETPAMENLSTLMGKYGDEGDKLLFRILNSGQFMDGLTPDERATASSLDIANKISEKGLRYDLTVPFARYVVMHRHEISFPFKRYQIQPVWRADRPQKGRYREFYQCDADIVGSESLYNELELIQLIDEVFRRFDLRIRIKLNNRKILSGIAEILGESVHLTDMAVAIDKLEKTSLQQVNEELAEKGLSETSIRQLQPILQLSGTNEEKLNKLDSILSSSETGRQGIREMRTVLELIRPLSLQAIVELDLCLARGLNYYTGIIIEVKALDAAMGSISGGGRYDNLTGVFGLPDVSGVGISFGADRIYDVLNSLDLFPTSIKPTISVLFLHFGPADAAWCQPLIQSVREAGIPAELYPDPVKIKKQMSYADDRHFSHVVIAGETEVTQGQVTIKNMLTGNQLTVAAADLVSQIMN